MKQFECVRVHIGLHKTGTTTMQNFLFTHRADLLQEHRVLYPGLAANLSRPLHSAFTDDPASYPQNIQAGVNTPEAAEAYNRQTLQTLEQEFRQSRATQLLMSGEDLCMLSVDSWRRFLKWLEPWSDDVRIICAVRDPLRWSVSAAQSIIRGGSTYEAVNKHPPLQLVERRLQRIVEVFGAAALEVIDFEKALRHPAGLMGGFSQALGIPEQWAGERSVPRRNESMTLEAAYLISALNEAMPLFSDGALGEGRQRGDIRQILLETGGQTFTLSEAAQRHVLQKSQEDLDWLEATFGLRLSCSAPSAARADSDGAVVFSAEAIETVARQLHDRSRVVQNNAELTRRLNAAERTPAALLTLLGRRFGVFLRGLKDRLTRR